MRNVLQEVIKSALHFVYPKVCLVCESLLRENEASICQDCEDDFDTFTKPEEASSRMLAKIRELLPEQQLINGAIAKYQFHKHGKLQLVIHAIKYEGLMNLAKKQGRKLGEFLRQEKSLNEYDAIVPIPLHHLRKIERGYNQAEILAQGVSEVIHLPIENCLQRIRYTSTQTKLDLETRQTNIQNAFTCSSNLRGASIMLIDDVFTTGSTMLAAAKPLKEAGAKKIFIATLAIAAS